MPRKPKSTLNPATDHALSALDAMWADVDAACEKAGLTVRCERPPGGFTIAEFAQRRQIPRNTAQEQLERMRTSGKLERYSVRLPDARGHLSPMAVYVVIP